MKKLSVLLLAYFAISKFLFSQGVGINNSGDMPSSDAMLDISSTQSGLLIPRMTEAQRDAINSGAFTQSLLIYQTDGDSGFYYYDGSNWTTFLTKNNSASGGWSLSGNTGTTVGTNFLGTTDAEDFAIYTNNTERVRINQNGNVGIGTTGIPHGGIGYARFAMDGTSGNAAGPHVQYSVSTNNYPVFQQLNWSHDNISMGFDAYYDGAWKSSDPGSNFQIYKFSDKLSMRYESGIAAGSGITWDDGIVLNTDGNVGIGIGSPLTPLHISKVGGTTDFLTLRADRNSSDTEVGIMFRDRNVVANSQQAARIWSERQGAAADFDLVFSTSDVGGADVLGEAMRIDHLGNVGIGEAAPSEILHLAGDGSVRIMLEADEDNVTESDHPQILFSQDNGAVTGLIGFSGSTNHLRIGNSWASADADIDFQTQGTTRMTVDGVGNIGIGTTSPTYKLHVNGRLKTDGNNETSDVRLKKDITTIDHALEKLLQLRGVTYKWKTEQELKQENLDPEQAPLNTNVTEVGLIAQELEAIIPEVVNTDVDGYKSVQYSKLVALLIEAVKEQNNTIQEYKTEIEALKSEITYAKQHTKQDIATIKAILEKIEHPHFNDENHAIGKK